MNIIDSKLKFNSNHSERSGDPEGVVLHHAAASSASVETVHGWHLGNGWAGIGYHFYVRKNGSVYRGRPEKWIGAHTSGHNEKIGICAEGNFETETMPEAQRKATIELLEYLFDKYGDMKVYKHKDLDSTACPGKNYPFDSIVKAAKEDKVLYCVQVGAFAVKANADNLLAKLKKAGYSDAFITTKKR
jgi:N-acetyl-anhydromuramyl-L-alanine amidase AmpD